jgi:hypothetical protein
MGGDADEDEVMPPLSSDDRAEADRMPSGAISIQTMAPITSDAVIGAAPRTMSLTF